MKITKQRLQEIVKEEVERALIKEYTSYAGGHPMGTGVPAYDPHRSPAEEEPMDAMTTIDLLLRARIGVAQNMPEGVDDLDHVIGLLTKKDQEPSTNLPSGDIPGFVRR